MPHFIPAKKMWMLMSTLCLAVALSACNETTNNTHDQHATAIESGEECHLCGMIITKFPGPKGQLYQRGNANNLKFCSTRDMFAYFLDPEHQHNIQQAFVHNMAVNTWEQPDDKTYIDAREAWYVIGSNKRGAMGPTLASFADQKSANSFADKQGGKLYQFDDLNLDLISSMEMGTPPHKHTTN
jgi:copper chaperone NosL